MKTVSRSHLYASLQQYTEEPGIDLQGKWQPQIGQHAQFFPHDDYNPIVPKSDYPITHKYIKTIETDLNESSYSHHYIWQK